MQCLKLSKRNVLKASGAFLAASVFANRLNATAPAASVVTPSLVEAARREGKASFYTALDLLLAERIRQAFEAKYPGVSVRVERSGAERVFQRISQERASRIFAVDVACSTDAAHFLSWKRNGMLAPYISEDMAKYFPAEHVDVDGMYATVCAFLSVIGYNSNLVKSTDVPASFYDLLDPKWAGKMVKGHPAYSGVILTATFLIVREFGWQYLEKLAKQRVMQVQSSLDPPKKIAAGERAVMIDGNDNSLELLREQGRPAGIIYAAEGSPLIVVSSGVFDSAPNPNAARLFQSFLFSIEGQQIFVTNFANRSFHAQVKEPPGRTPLAEIKLMKADPAAVESQSEEIKARYAKIFGV